MKIKEARAEPLWVRLKRSGLYTWAKSMVREVKEVQRTRGLTPALRTLSDIYDTLATSDLGVMESYLWILFDEIEKGSLMDPMKRISLENHWEQARKSTVLAKREPTEPFLSQSLWDWMSFLKEADEAIKTMRAKDPRDRPAARSFPKIKRPKRRRAIRESLRFDGRPINQIVREWEFYDLITWLKTRGKGAYIGGQQIDFEGFVNAFCTIVDFWRQPSKLDRFFKEAETLLLKMIKVLPKAQQRSYQKFVSDIFYPLQELLHEYVNADAGAAWEEATVDLAVALMDIGSKFLAIWTKTEKCRRKRYKPAAGGFPKLRVPKRRKIIREKLIFGVDVDDTSSSDTVPRKQEAISP